MAPRLSVDDRLRSLREIRDRGDLSEIRKAAIKSLADNCNLVIADAAKLIRDFELSGTEDGLLKVWKTLFEHPDPIKVDKGCFAKTAIVEALARLGHDAPDFYLAAMSYKQIEPNWPAAEDTADHVRANAAFALVPSKQLRLVDKLNAFVDLLQGTPNDHCNAARAIVDTGSEMAVPVLRLKLLLGDPDAEVLGICMSGMLTIAPGSSIPVVASFLNHHDENVAIEAALALGSSNLPKSLEPLIQCWNRIHEGELKRSLLISIGLSRNPSAIEFLISQLESRRYTDDVLEALKPACVYDETRNRVRQILDRVGHQKQIAEFERRFGRSAENHSS